MGSTPWKLSDNSGHFGFQVQLQKYVKTACAQKPIPL
ncbi:hypothetical protein FQN60_017131 [Etheostoma spectabile]|uniref:Uncharacterized protein n=1 Tax=Etheostoma spectabile TaxID=54343 RepID=A0A5J5DEP2_9PERO|nr:hypothetical protein FQN60_017131 [Etheostoma spectabile]